MEEVFKVEREELDVNLMNPLIWAYVGDAVYELYIRTYLINTTDLKPNKLHKESIKFVKAKAQAEMLKTLEDKLTQKEKEVVKRGRNAKNHHIAKHAEVAEYAYSTAFEGLIGYLYLTKQDNRLKQILNYCVEKEKTE